MTRIRWTRPALAHIAELHDFIATDNPPAARRVVTQIQKGASLLANHPDAGRPGRVPGTRELVVSHAPFIIAYRRDGDVVSILAVVHSARRWPEQLT